tara:strand:+ start:49279 stop:50553 length:1275 start_codon:yes stop_codon:yes gene_type:complete
MKKAWDSKSSSYRKSINKMTTGLRSKEAKEKRDEYFSSDLHKSKARAQALKLAAERKAGSRPPCAGKTCDTKPELAVENVLKLLDISYQKQCEIGFYSFDFHLINFNILLEVQGEYWHSLPNNIRNDLAKSDYLKKHADLKIVYINERDTLSINKLKEILKDITQKDVKLIDFNFTDVRVTAIEQHEAISFMSKYHYLPRFRKNTRKTYGIFLKDILIGVTIFANPSYNTVCKRHNLQNKQVLELVRLIVDPRYQKHNLISFSLSRSIKLIKKDPDICLLISFSDPHFGHTGTVYKASNWIEDGSTRPSYYYEDDRGNIYHKKTMWDHASKMKLTEKEYTKLNNFRRVNTVPKNKFIFWIKRSNNVDVAKVDLVDAVCQCGNIRCLKPKNFAKAVAKHGKYLCHSCALKKWHKNKKSLGRNEKV